MAELGAGLEVKPAGTSDGAAHFTVSKRDTMAMDAARPVPRRKTTFFDKLDMLNKPPPSEIGLAAIVEESRTWWPRLTDPTVGKRILSLDAVRERAAKLDDNVPVVIDFEDIWDEAIGRARELRLDIRQYTARQVAQDLEVVSSLINAYRAGGFTGKIGLYGLIPNSEVNWNLLKRHPRYPAEQRLWQVSNQMLGLSGGIIDLVDVIHPALYAIGPDVNQHLEWCEATIDEAKKYGKPVVPYISPESHYAATGGFAKKLLSQPQWQGTLELIRRKEVDAVLWMGGDNNFKHDFSAGPEWWFVLEELRKKWAAETIRPR